MDAEHRPSSAKKPKHVTKPAVPSSVRVIKPPHSSTIPQLSVEDDDVRDSFLHEDVPTKMKQLSIPRAPVSTPTLVQPAATEICTVMTRIACPRQI